MIYNLVISSTNFPKFNITFNHQLTVPPDEPELKKKVVDNIGPLKSPGEDLRWPPWYLLPTKLGGWQT